MQKLIQEYQKNYRLIKQRIYELERQLHTEKFRTMERERIKARINTLKEEEFEIVNVLNEMRRHLS